MNIFPPETSIASRSRDPRVVVGIIYSVGSIYLTNRPWSRQVPLVNPGFESGTGSGWSLYADADVSGAEARSGIYAVRSVKTGGTTVDIADQFANAVEGQRFRLSCYAMRDESDLPNEQFRLVAQFYDSGMSPVLTGQGIVHASTGVSGWQFLQGAVITAPANTAYIRFYLRWDDPAGTFSGTWYADDCRLERVVGIDNVPGNAVHGVITNISSTTQRLEPDRARATIGTLSVEAVDLGGAVTEEIRNQLDNNAEGVRGREVRVFTGDTDDFNDFVRVETYVVDDAVKLVDHRYTFECSDRNREQRVEVFEQRTTRLNASITESSMTLTVEDTTGFEALAHTASFSDAPSATVGYLYFKKTKEIVRWTSKDGTHFTLDERGVFGTIPKAIEVDGTQPVDKHPEVIEYIYLEMPAPELDYAVKTGKIRSSGAMLPDAWHMGIDEAHVDGQAYDDIGTDLYDPTDVTAGLVLRFLNLEKTDGKQFCEEQLHFPMQTFPPITANGVITIRRIASIVDDAAPIALITPGQVVSQRGITHATGRVINRVRFLWNFDGEDYTRVDEFVNLTSVSVYGASKVREIELRGLHVSGHSRARLQIIFDSIVERYGAPPIELPLRLTRELVGLEAGDVAFAALPRVRDYAGASYLARAFEIQSRRVNWLTGELDAQCFGSTVRQLPDSGAGVSAVLGDAWYTATGTELSTVLTISAGSVTANGTLTGGADARTSVFYFDGDLTIDNGVTVTITGNVQLRIKGTLTVNGKLDGAAQGVAALADPNTVDTAWVGYQSAYTSYYFGTTQPSGGIYYVPGQGLWRSWLGQSLKGVHASAPRLAIDVDESDNLLGLPKDLRGVPGAYGAPVIEESGGQIVRALGGAGGAGGAGLLIVTRGLAFGASGEIDLSGGSGSAPAGTVNLGGVDLYPGAGAGGAPGVLYAIMDGDTVPFPDLTDALTVDRGATPQTGTPLDGFSTYETPPNNTTGYFAGFGSADMWTAAHLVQYVPDPDALGEGADDAVGAPTSLSVVGSPSGAIISWNLPPAGTYDYVEIFEATSNDRSGAVLLYRGRASSITITSATQVTRYYWARGVREGAAFPGFSEWEPVSATGGVAVTFGGADKTSQNIAADTALVDGVSATRIRQSGRAVYINQCETSEQGDWSEDSGKGNTLTFDADALQGSFAALQAHSGTGTGGSSGGSTEGSHLRIPAAIANQWSEQRILVSVIAKQPSTNAASQFALSYSTSDVGNSTWQTFTPMASWQQFRFLYDVPAKSDFDDDFLGFLGDASGGGAATLFDQVVIEVVPKDADIDLTQATNAVAEANADNTAGNPQSPSWLSALVGASHVDANSLETVLNALDLVNGPAQADADETASNGQSPDWLTALILSSHVSANSLETVLNALDLINAPAEAGANETETRRSLTDWDETQQFTPNWTGFSTDPTGTLNYAVSKDGLWAKLWTDQLRVGSSDSAAMSITNLPLAIRPAGSSFRWSGPGVGAFRKATFDRIPAAAKLFEASHASGGTIEFGSLTDPGSGAALDFDTVVFAGGGSKGFEKGVTLIWPLD